MASLPRVGSGAGQRNAHLPSDFQHCSSDAHDASHKKAPQDQVPPCSLQSKRELRSKSRVHVMFSHVARICEKLGCGSFQNSRIQQFTVQWLNLDPTAMKQKKRHAWSRQDEHLMFIWCSQCLVGISNGYIMGMPPLLTIHSSKLDHYCSVNIFIHRCLNINMYNWCPFL